MTTPSRLSSIKHESSTPKPEHSRIVPLQPQRLGQNTVQLAGFHLNPVIVAIVATRMLRIIT